MGELEISLKKEIKIGKIQKAILGSVAAVGLLSVALVLPNALQALKLFGWDKKLINRSQKNSINSSRQKLVKGGLLEYQGKFLRLTLKGKKILEKIEAQNYKIKIP